MKSIDMKKVLPFLDEIPELEKRVFTLQLLDDLDITSLTPNELNCFVGVFHDTVSLLKQSVSDLYTLSNILTGSSDEVGTSEEVE